MLKVLLVDDEPTILRLLRAVLEMHHYSVKTAGTAREAIALLTPGAFDIVITDLRMETPLAGFEVVAAAKRLAPRPLIMLLTAFPVPAAEWKAAGADALHIKGMETPSLPEQLKSLVQQRAAKNETPERPLASGE
jgi:CheY-like chemotaxis protein